MIVCQTERIKNPELISCALNPGFFCVCRSQKFTERGVRRLLCGSAGSPARSTGRRWKVTKSDLWTKYKSESRFNATSELQHEPKRNCNQNRYILHFSSLLSASIKNNFPFLCIRTILYSMISSLPGVFTSQCSKWFKLLVINVPTVRDFAVLFFFFYNIFNLF